MQIYWRYTMTNETNDEQIEQVKQTVYQVLVTNIRSTPIEQSWGYRNSKKENKITVPDTFTFNLPKTLVTRTGAKKLYDAIETHVYNYISKKFRCEVNACQIWLMF